MSYCITRGRRCWHVLDVPGWLSADRIRRDWSLYWRATFKTRDMARQWLRQRNIWCDETFVRGNYTVLEPLRLTSGLRTSIDVRGDCKSDAQKLPLFLVANGITYEWRENPKDNLWPWLLSFQIPDNLRADMSFAIKLSRLLTRDKGDITEAICEEVQS